MNPSALALGRCPNENGKGQFAIPLILYLRRIILTEIAITAKPAAKSSALPGSGMAGGGIGIGGGPVASAAAGTSQATKPNRVHTMRVILTPPGFSSFG